MGEIKALTSLRGLAAMMVVMQHFSATAERHACRAHSVPCAAWIYGGGPFLHAERIHHGLHVPRGFRSARRVRAMPDFLIKRAARILPLNTTMVIVIVLAGLLSQSVLGNNIFSASSHILFDAILQYPAVAGVWRWHEPEWSLVVRVHGICRLFAVSCSARTGFLPAFCRCAADGPCRFRRAGHRGLEPFRGLGLTRSFVEGALTRCFAQFVIGLCTFRLTLVS